ncbi:MAG TPA: hypothetical protein VGM89_06635 [Puia sp.]
MIGCFVVLLAPNFATAQEDYRPAVFTYNEGGPAISSNVPLNEINAHAYRHFQRLFPTGTSNEYWFVSSDGYQVSFVLDGRQCQAFFDRHGAYRYSLKYYPGKEIPRLAGDLIRSRYAEYRIDVVTEITDGEKTFYLVKIANPVSIKTLSLSDGKIDLLEELTNAGPETPLISRRSYP